AVVVQSDELPLSTWLVAPTSTSARAASFRPEVEIAGQITRVLAEQTAAVDPNRLGERSGELTFDELRRVDAALRLVLTCSSFGPVTAAVQYGEWPRMDSLGAP